MRREKFHITKFLKYCIFTLLIIIVAIIIANFSIRSLKQPKIAMKSEKKDILESERREAIEHFEEKGGKANLKIQADKQYLGEDGLYHLEGNVEVVFLDKGEEQDIFLSGDKISYDKNKKNFFSRYHSEIRFKDIVVSSSSLEYHRNWEVLRSNDVINFVSDRFKGSAIGMVYSIKNGNIKLLKNVSLELKRGLNTHFPFIIKGRRMEYSRPGRRGVIKGNVRLFHGNSSAKSDSGEFELFPSEDLIKSLSLKGNAKASLITEEGKEVPSNRGYFVLYNEKREIKADEIYIRRFKDVPEVNKVAAKGNSSVKFISASGKFSLIQGENIEFVFSKDGKLSEFNATENVIIIEEAGSPEDCEYISGESLVLEAKPENILHLKGSSQKKARIWCKEYEIYSDNIDIFLDSNDLEARDGVRVVLKEGTKEEKQFGFFSKKEHILISAEQMRNDEDKNRFSFKENIRMWQANRVLQASELYFDRDTGKIFCREGIRSFFAYKTKDKKEKKVEIDARRMDFIPDKSLILYTEKTSLKLKNVNLHAEAISVYLDEESGDIKNIVASGKVIITQDKNEGRGEKARFDSSEETIVLSGNPVLINKDMGRIEGDKLTFYIADDKIVVENKNQVRSKTFIKS